MQRVHGTPSIVPGKPFVHQAVVWSVGKGMMAEMSWLFSAAMDDPGRIKTEAAKREMVFKLKGCLVLILKENKCEKLYWVGTVLLSDCPGIVTRIYGM